MERPIVIGYICPDGHQVEADFAARYGHAGLRDLLDAGTLMFYCPQCETDFPPTEEGIMSLRDQLAGGPLPPGLHYRPFPELPKVQPEEIRAALDVIIALRRRAGLRGPGLWAFHDPHMGADLEKLGADLHKLTPAVNMRATILLSGLERGILDRWRDGETLQPVVFAVAATYEWALNENHGRPDFEGFIAALEALT